jgi:ribosomal protein S19E (S16A)
VDRRNLFVFLRSRLSGTEARNYSGDVKEWSVQKKKNYYDRLASILKQIMLDNDLEVKLR